MASHLFCSSVRSIKSLGGEASFSRKDRPATSDSENGNRERDPCSPFGKRSSGGPCKISVSAPPNHTRPRGRPRWSRRGRGTSPHRPLTPFGLGATARATRPAIAPPQGDFQPAARTRAQCGASRPSARRPRGGQRTILAVAAVRGSRAKMGRPARCSRLARRRAPRLDPAGTRSPHAPCRFFSLLGSAHPRSACAVRAGSGATALLTIPGPAVSAAAAT